MKWTAEVWQTRIYRATIEVEADTEEAASTAADQKAVEMGADNPAFEFDRVQDHGVWCPEPSASPGDVNG